MDQVRRDQFQEIRDEAIASPEYEAAAQLLELARTFGDRRRQWHAEIARERTVVTADDIATVVSMWSGFPVTSLSSQETARLLRMEKEFHKRIMGQDEAIVRRPGRQWQGRHQGPETAARPASGQAPTRQHPPAPCNEGLLHPDRNPHRPIMAGNRREPEPPEGA